MGNANSRAKEKRRKSTIGFFKFLSTKSPKSTKPVSTKPSEAGSTVDPVQHHGEEKVEPVEDADMGLDPSKGFDLIKMKEKIFPKYEAMNRVYKGLAMQGETYVSNDADLECHSLEDFRTDKFRKEFCDSMIGSINLERKEKRKLKSMLERMGSRFSKQGVKEHEWFGHSWEFGSTVSWGRIVILYKKEDIIDGKKEVEGIKILWCKFIYEFTQPPHYKLNAPFWNERSEYQSAWLEYQVLDKLEKRFGAKFIYDQFKGDCFWEDETIARALAGSPV